MEGPWVSEAEHWLEQRVAELEAKLTAAENRAATENRAKEGFVTESEPNTGGTGDNEEL